MLAGIIAIMMKMNWKLALITFAVLPVIAYATKIFRDKVRDSYRRIRTAIARINSYLQEAVSGMLVLQLFNREKRAFNKFSDINASHMEAYKDAIMAYAVYYPVVDFLSSIAIASIIWFGGNGILRHTVISGIGFSNKRHIILQLVRISMTLGVLNAFVQYAQRFFRPILDLSEKYNILQSAMAAGERVFKLLDTKIEVTSPAIAKEPRGPGRIEFDHVWFAYGNKPAAEEPADSSSRLERAGAPVPTQTGEPDWVLRDVSFVLEPGETIAVVGHTGAGKTTLISLLMRFYDVQRGAIRIDGVDIKEMDLDDLRGRFGVVLQDPFLFSGTVASNIRLGTARIQDADVEQAAEDVNLADFIRTLPGGFQEEVRERGSTLSTGQKQLISFARALAHNPKILILDEATSSVDTETELRVRAALNRMVEGRTALIIAHRLSTIQPVSYTHLIWSAASCGTLEPETVSAPDLLRGSLARIMAPNHEEEVLGKAYDGRLMRRLLTYLRPYKWHVVVALAAIILKSGLDVLGPFLTMIAIDKYLAKSPNSHSWIGDRLSNAPLTGIAQIGGIYVGILLFTFALEFIQTYLMQWTGQKVMFDLRSQIFRHLQHMHVEMCIRDRVGCGEADGAADVGVVPIDLQHGVGIDAETEIGLARPIFQVVARLVA